MNSITLDHSFWVKVGQTFFNLFIGCNSVIVFSESSKVLSDVYFIVRDSPILSSGPSPLCSSTFVETFTAKFKFIRGDVKAAVCLTA